MSRLHRVSAARRSDVGFQFSNCCSRARDLLVADTADSPSGVHGARPSRAGARPHVESRAVDEGPVALVGQLLRPLDSPGKQRIANLRPREPARRPAVGCEWRTIRRGDHGVRRVVAAMIHNHTDRRGRQEPIGMQAGRRHALEHVYGFAVKRGDHLDPATARSAQLPFSDASSMIQRTGGERMIPCQELQVLAQQRALPIARVGEAVGLQARESRRPARRPTRADRCAAPSPRPR